MVWNLYLASIDECIFKVLILLDELFAQVARVLEVCIQGDVDVEA